MQGVAVSVDVSIGHELKVVSRGHSNMSKCHMSAHARCLLGLQGRESG